MGSRTGNPFAGVEKEIQKIANSLSGTLGVAVKTLETGSSFFQNERVLFPAASTIKIHVLLELFNQVRAGKHKLDDIIEIPTKNRFGAEWGPMSDGVLKELESVTQLSLKDVATLMIIVSDNVAANLLIDLLGIERIQETIRSLGLKNTKLARKFFDLESSARGLENISTPYDMMETLMKIAKAEILGAESCKAILDILRRTQDVSGLRKLIPHDIRIEHKTGEGLYDVCNDVGIVRLLGNPFILCVMTKGVSLVRGWDAIAEVGKIFYDRLSAHSREDDK